MKSVRQFKPFRSRIYVKVFQLPLEEILPSGVIVSKRAHQAEIETGVRAKIVTIGEGCEDEIFEHHKNRGGWLLIPRFTGTRLSIDTSFLIISEDCVMGFLNEAEALAEVGVTKAESEAATKVAQWENKAA